MAFWREVDVISSPRSAGHEEERLTGDEVDVVFVERRVEFDHVEVTEIGSK